MYLYKLSKNVLCVIVFLLMGSIFLNAQRTTDRATNVTIATSGVFGSAIAYLSIDCQKIWDRSASSGIYWTNSSGGWNLANDMVEVTYTNNNTGWGILILTDNTNSSLMGPLAQGGNGNYGLLGVANDGSWNSEYMTLHWIGRDDYVNASTYGAIDADIGTCTNHYDAGGGPTPLGIMKDYSDFNESTDLEYCSLVNSSGVQDAWWDSGEVLTSRRSAASPIYVYFRQRRKTLQPLGAYKTMTITFEMFHQ